MLRALAEAHGSVRFSPARVRSNRAPFRPSFAIPGLAVTPVRADVRLELYLGASQTVPSTLFVEQAARGNDARFNGVRWRGFPFRASPYYGVRFAYRAPGSEIALDFTHYKIYAPLRNA